MLLHRPLHRPFPSPDLSNNPSYFKSDNPLSSSESPIIDGGSQTIMPALLLNRASMLSDPSHDALQNFPSQAYIGPERSYAWPKSELSANFGPTSLDCRMELSASTIRSPTRFGDGEDQAKGEGKWGMGFRQQLPTPFSSLSPPFNSSSLETDHELIPSAQVNLAIRSPPTHESQLPAWTQFATGNALEETEIYTPSQAYAYDTAPSFGSSLYATSSDIRTPSQPKLRRPFRGKERLDPLDSESESEGKQGEPPYAKLIYRALMDAPDHQMVLKDIYLWIAQNTDKARDPAFKGWQNSVRHNLSMNGVRLQMALRTEFRYSHRCRLSEKFPMLIHRTKPRKASFGSWSPRLLSRVLNLLPDIARRRLAKEATTLTRRILRGSDRGEEEGEPLGSLPNCEDRRCFSTIPDTPHAPKASSV